MKPSILLIAVLFATCLQAQTGKRENNGTALLLIDIQEFYFSGGRLLLEGSDEAVNVASSLLRFFRQHHLPVVHVMHQGGGEIHPLVAPEKDEKVFVKKEVNSFLGTGLYDYLKQLGIQHLVLAGMQTHMCLEAAVRAASDYGFRCTVIQDACATRTLVWEKDTVPARKVQAAVFAALKAYASILPAAEFINQFAEETK